MNTTYELDIHLPNPGRRIDGPTGKEPTGRRPFRRRTHRRLIQSNPIQFDLN